VVKNDNKIEYYKDWNFSNAWMGMDGNYYQANCLTFWARCNMVPIKGGSIQLVHLFYQYIILGVDNGVGTYIALSLPSVLGFGAPIEVVNHGAIVSE